MLERALASILAQVEPRWEAVIVNDGGRRAPIDEIVEKHRERSAGRIRVLHHETSLGRWPAANAGVNASHAPFVVLHDDDDTWHREFLLRTSHYLEQHPDEWGVIARTEVVQEEYEDEDTLREIGRYVLEEHHDRVHATDMLKFNRFVPIGFLYRRALHDRVGLYDASLPAAADWAFNMRALTVHPLNYVDDEVLAYWHQRPGVKGIEGNSVFAAPADHRAADRTHRDNELRAYVESYGWGLPLYLSSLAEQSKLDNAEMTRRTDELVAGLHARLNTIDASLEALQHHLDRSLDTRIRGWLWRQKQRLRRLRR